jgi:AcrR family transcriptional regulator
VNRSGLILEAAVREFYEHGFESAGVADIAARAGIAASAIYRHFESKDEILATIVDRALDSLQSYAGPHRDDPQVELEALITGHVEFALTEYQLSAIWAQERFTLVEPYRRRVLRRQMSYVERWVRCLDDCYPGRRRNDVLAVVRAVQSVIMSDTMRATPAQRSTMIKELLVAVARRAVEALEDVPVVGLTVPAGAH